MRAWHCRAWRRAVESGPDGEDLAAGAWQRLEALPGPRSPQGRIYPLACLIAIALCAFTVAGNDRFTEQTDPLHLNSPGISRIAHTT